MIDQLSDEALMSAVMSGKSTALAMLVERYHSLLLGYIYRLVGGDRPLAEDIVQETFLHILQKSGYQAGRPFKPWLYAIATNLVRDHFKSAAVRRVVSQDSNEELAQYEYATAGNPEVTLSNLEQGYEIAAALSRLGEEYRVALVLRFYHGLSLQEIADVLHIPLGTVKSRLSVGTHRLRDLLKSLKEGVE
jgi:RNA polymerase sigma-70 factor (ECF subfamily)